MVLVHRQVPRGQREQRLPKGKRERKPGASLRSQKGGRENGNSWGTTPMNRSLRS